MSARLGILVLAAAAAVHAMGTPAEVATLRALAPLTGQPAVEGMSDQEALGHVRTRSYPMQAPTIPHAIEGFAITRDFNQCLLCHNAQMAPSVKAPAIGVSHYRNRSGAYLSDVSPRRFFCNQCHVPQLEVAPPVANSYKP